MLHMRHNLQWNVTRAIRTSARVRSVRFAARASKVVTEQVRTRSCIRDDIRAPSVISKLFAVTVCNPFARLCAVFSEPTLGASRTQRDYITLFMTAKWSILDALVLCLEGLCYMQTVFEARDTVWDQYMLEFTVVVPTENRVLNVFRIFLLLLPPWFSCNIPHLMNRNSAKTLLPPVPLSHRSLTKIRASMREDMRSIKRVESACARIRAVRKEQKLISRKFCNKSQDYTPEIKLFIQDNCEFLVFYAE